ncbi:MAG TPA: lytic transglycosylase domain-containing protein [Thermoanaerobaculia bacterium]|nr:lytic transglycosylase domain-containing protein [Thermoanaerobaculia bacterium]
MLQWFRRKWFLSVVLVVVLAGLGGAAFYFMRYRVPTVTGEDPGTPVAKPQAPPDLQNLRAAYTAGVQALQRDDGAEAVRQLSSFDFGSRAVEEYRLYYLANAYELTGDANAARLTLAQLWRRSPRLIHANDAGFHLAGLYATGGDASRSADVYMAIARRADVPTVAAAARWNAVGQYLRAGDVAGALFNARDILIHHPRSAHAEDAAALVRTLTGTAEKSVLPLTASERVERAIALMQSNDSQTALEELTALEPKAPQLRQTIQLQRGIALHFLKRYEDSNKVLEPLTSGPFKIAIPALRTTAKSYAIVASSINPIVIKNVKEKKKVGTVKVRVGKGKKRRTVKKPKYQTVTKQVKLVDLAKKSKKDENERLASERLKDLLSLDLDPNVRLETLNTLAARAQAKNQDPYLQELVPQIIKIDPNADPALQHFWDKGWAAYTRGDLAGARKLFRFIADHYTHPNVRRQSEYWHARTIERLGLKAEAAAIYQKLASAPYADLYAMHAVTRGAKQTRNSTNPLEKSGPDWRELAEKQMPPELQLAYELTALASMREAYQEVRKNSRRENIRFAEALMADYHHATGSEVLMYRSLRRAWPQLATVEQDSAPAYFLRMYYPQKYGDEIEDYAQERDLDPNLVRALILQESYYNPKAKSRVGATGLMQLMPPTAKEHAARMRIPFAVSRLENPEVNVRLGTYHLKMLINMFSGNTYLAVASYNAGQGNVMKWRRAAPKKPIDEFIESIPFQETRNYVKRVTMLRSSYARLTL